MAFTWNPADKHAEITLSNGNLTAEDTVDTNYSLVRATESLPVSSKKYWEVTIDAVVTAIAWAFCIGVADAGEDLNTWVGHGASWAYHYNGSKAYDGSRTAFGSSYTVGDVISIAVDESTHKIWFAKNGVWQASGDPANGSNPAFTMADLSYYPAWSGQKNGDQVTVNFGATPFVYTPPPGFYAPDVPTKFFDGKVRIKNESIANLLDGKARVDILAPSFFDGKANVKDSAVKLFNGRAEVIGWKADLLDGKAEVAGLDADLLDGKINLTTVTTDLFNGKALVCLEATNLLDGKVKLQGKFTDLLDGKTLIKFGEAFNLLDGKAAVQGATPDLLDGKCTIGSPAQINANSPVPTGNFVVGKKIEGDSPVPDFTCIAYPGRNPSLIANAPCPTCSMRVGLSLSDIATISRKAGIPIPTCTMVADTHHLATIYGRVPSPLLTCDADTENITIISASVPCPTGLFEVTVGNVASILGRVPCPYCTMVALTGQVVALSGRVPVPGSLVRFIASLENVTITLEGTVPTPTMTSGIPCFTSSILRYIRGKIR